MLVKLTKIQSSGQFFALSGSALVKAACRTLMKLKPGLSSKMFLSNKLTYDEIDVNSEKMIFFKPQNLYQNKD